MKIFHQVSGVFISFLIRDNVSNRGRKFNLIPSFMFVLWTWNKTAEGEKILVTISTTQDGKQHSLESQHFYIQNILENCNEKIIIFFGLLICHTMSPPINYILIEETTWKQEKSVEHQFILSKTDCL